MAHPSLSVLFTFHTFKKFEGRPIMWRSVVAGRREEAGEEEKEKEGQKSSLTLRDGA